MLVDFLEPSQGSADTCFIECIRSDRVENAIQFGMLKECNKQVAPEGLPHEEIFFTLLFLDLFSIERVCKSMRTGIYTWNII